MDIVLNERDWAEEMITTRSLGKKPLETMRRVARYYIDNGVPKKEVRRMLDGFLVQCDPTVSLPKWSDALDSALSAALKRAAVDISYITVTKPEMDRIDAAGGKQVRRLAFTLLCLAKYWDIVSDKKLGWVNNKDSDIMRMANINTSIKRQSMMYFNLREAGMIEFSRKVDSTNVRVCFMEDGETALRITDFRNLGYQYMLYHGGPYFVCANCGVTERMDNPNKGRKQKYCKSCLSEVAVQRRVNKAMGRPAQRDGEKKYTVYMHEFPDGHVYIGTTSQALRDRWKNGAGYRGTRVGEAIQDCGWDNVRHFILSDGLSLAGAKSVEDEMIRERKAYLPQYGYNVREAAESHTHKDDPMPAVFSKEVDGSGLEMRQ